MERRILGRTGISAGIFGFGGIMVRDTDRKDADAVVARAVDAGVDYFDVAPSYGNAQDVLGPSIEPYRNRITLACKTEKRDGAGTKEELEGSLKALKTDHFDIYQLHALATLEDVDKALAPGGALEAIDNARKEGKVRFIGFSSHNDGASLKAMEGFDFDSVLTPVNWACQLRNGFAKGVIEAAEERDMARLAIKALAYGAKIQGSDGSKWWYQPIMNDERLAELALRFTLSQPVHIAISPGDIGMFDLGLSIISKNGGSLPHLNETELAELDERAQAVPKALFGE